MFHINLSNEKRIVKTQTNADLVKCDNISLVAFVGEIDAQ